MVIGVNEKKPKFYDGENKYKLIFDFLNVFSETFFKVGEDKTKVSEVTKQDKPWLNEVKIYFKFSEIPRINKRISSGSLLQSRWNCMRFINQQRNTRR